LTEFFGKIGLIALVLYVPSVWIFLKSRNYLVAAISLLGPLAVVFGDVVVKCNIDSVSEACVWGKSFLPLTLGLAISLGTPVLFLLLTGLSKVCKVARRTT
jgi:hypothetical protein